MRPLRLLLCWLAVLTWRGCSAAGPDEARRRLLLLAGSRARRSLLYPQPGSSETKVQVLFGLGLPTGEEPSTTLGYVVKCNYELPYNASHRAEGTARRRQQQPSRGSRWGLYRMLEAALGRGCLLRAVCEAAELPLACPPRLQGLLGELLRVALAPSATGEDYEVYADREYRAAEARGRGAAGCRHFHRDCSYSPLDYFTRVLPAAQF